MCAGGALNGASPREVVRVAGQVGRLDGHAADAGGLPVGDEAVAIELRYPSGLSEVCLEEKSSVGGFGHGCPF